MAGYRTKVISMTKAPGQTFGFYLRVEHGEEGHLIRCLELGGPAELAGMKDGDRILQVNGTFVDALSHAMVVDLVKSSGATVTFHVLDEASYKQAKEQGVNLSSCQSTPVANGRQTVDKQASKAKLCYVVRSGSSHGFSIRSVKGEKGLFMTDVIPGSAADNAGIKANDRLVEVNGENVEDLTHDQGVDKIKLAGSSIMFLLVDEEADRYYKNKHTKIGTWLATVTCLPHKPRIINMTKGPDGFGFLLREDPRLKGHFIKDIERGSTAERAGLREMDRLVAVDGEDVDNCSHDQVVQRFRQSGSQCRLLVVDRDTDQMYKLGAVSPMLYWDEMKESNSPPSYTEALSLSAPAPPRTPLPERREELKPKLCKMEKTSAGYGFHLNGIQGLCGQYIKEVVKGGVADTAGLEDDDIVVEVNGVNVEKRSHEDVVALIRSSGSSLEMLVARRSVYEQLKDKGVPITRLLLGDAHADVSTADRPEDRQERRHEQEARPTTPTETDRARSSSESSSSSEESVDIRF